MNYEKNTFPAKDGVKRTESQSGPAKDSVLTKCLMSDGSDTIQDMKRFDLQKEQLANKIQQLEALVKEATSFSPVPSSVDNITLPEMEFRSNSGQFANPGSIQLLRETLKGEPWPTVNRNPVEIPSVEKSHLELYCDPLDDDDLNEAIASSSETLVGEGPEDQTLFEAGGMTPTYVYRDSGPSFPFRDVAPELHSQRHCESSSLGGTGDGSHLPSHQSSQAAYGDNFVKNFDDFVEMRVNDAPRKENQFIVTQGHPKGLPVHTKSISCSGNVDSLNQENTKLKYSNLDGPSCRPKERRKHLKKSWSNQEALEPPASPDRRASYNDLFSFTADEFYRSRLGGLPSSNSDNNSTTSYNDDYNDVSLDNESSSYGEVRSGISYPNVDMNGRNIAEQINLTFKSKYNFDSDLKLPVDIKATPATSFGLPPDPTYVSHINISRNLHKKYGSEMKRPSPRQRRISKPLSVAETNKIYSSIKQSSKKMHRQSAVNDEGEGLGSSDVSESHLNAQLRPSIDAFNSGGERNEEMASYMELQRRTKLFFENIKKTDNEANRADNKNYKNRGRHSFPTDSADLPRPSEFETSNFSHTSSKSHDELDPYYDEQFYNFVPASLTARDPHPHQSDDNSFKVQEQLKYQNSEHAGLPPHSKFPSDVRPAPPTSLKFHDALPATSLFPPLGPLDRARSGPSTPIRPEMVSTSSSRMRSHESSIHDSYDLATRLENVQHRAYGSQPCLYGNLASRQIRLSEPLTLTTFGELDSTGFRDDIQPQPPYPQRQREMEPYGPPSPRSSREKIPFGSSSAVQPFETTTFEDSQTAQESPSFVEDFLPKTVCEPAPLAVQDLLKPPESVPVRRGSIVSCDTLQASLDPHPDPVKIVVLGDDGVGKTALIVRLVTGRFIGDYDPSLEAVYSYRIPLAGYTEQLQLMDTAGQGAWRGEETQLQWSDAVLVVFSVTSARSLGVARDILSRLVKTDPRAKEEGRGRSWQEGKDGHQTQAGVNDKESNERNEQGKEVEEDTLEDEEQQGMDGSGRENSYSDEKVEVKVGMSNPVYFEGKTASASFSQNQSNTQQSNCVSGKLNGKELCQEPVGVASLHKLAMATLRGLNTQCHTDSCRSRPGTNLECVTKPRTNEDKSSKHAAPTIGSFKHNEDLERYSIIESEIHSTSDIELHEGRSALDTSAMKRTKVGQCASAPSANEEERNPLTPFNLHGNIDSKWEKLQQSEQTRSNENATTVKNKAVNELGTGNDVENIETSSPAVIPADGYLNTPSITKDTISINCDSKQQENKTENSSSIKKIASCSSQTAESSTATQWSTFSCTSNLDKKNLSESSSPLLYKETVLVGNKSDLDHRREVSTAEGSALAEQYQCPFTEIAAAALWEVVSEPFLDLYCQVIEGRKRKLVAKNCDNQEK